MAREDIADPRTAVEKTADAFYKAWLRTLISRRRRPSLNKHLNGFRGTREEKEQLKKRLLFIESCLIWQTKLRAAEAKARKEQAFVRKTQSGRGFAWTDKPLEYRSMFPDLPAIPPPM